MDNKEYNEENEDFNYEYNSSSDSDDEYGLADESFDTIDRENDDYEPHTPSREPEVKSKTPIIVSILVVLLVAAAGGAYFVFFKDAKPQPVVQAIIEEPVKIEEPVIEEPIVEEPVDTKPVVGEIIRLSERTGRSHVIVGSFFDEDNVLDYSNKLAKQGVNCTIIPPTGKSHFFRLSVQDFDSYSDAMAYAEDLKNSYTTEVWVLKY
jgi:hypothetical protein